jgi:heavy metal sensor kinase
VLLVAVLAFWWLARFALLPLSAVAAVAGKIDVNTLDTRVPVRGVYDELDRVAESFNQTLARLARAVGEMRQFSTALAHELRTPLAALRGQIELSLRSPGTSVPQRDRFVGQMEEIDRLTRLIDRVLTLARAESGQVQLTFAPVNLGSLTESLVEQLQPLAEARSIDLRCEGAEAVVVNGDTGWLERMLLNLLDNALKYTGPHGRIDVRVSRTQDTARIAVRDTGVGLSPEDTTRVFEKFFRADPARSSEAEGAGLGLSLVEWIAVRHGGSVTASSRLGEGSTFTVTLPLARNSS